MAAADNNGNGGQQQLQTATAADDKGSQDWVEGYEGEGQEQAARDGGDSRVVMMAAAKMANGSGGRQLRWMTTMMAVDGGGRQQQQMTMARKIGWRTSTGKVESRQQTTMALGRRDGEDDVVFGSTILCCFWRGLYNFVCVGVLLTKRKLYI